MILGGTCTFLFNPKVPKDLDLKYPIKDQREETEKGNLTTRIMTFYDVMMLS
jgi:hypothetical protein